MLLEDYQLPTSFAVLQEIQLHRPPKEPFDDGYWIPLYEVLEERGMEVLLVNAHYPEFSRSGFYKK